MISNHPTPRTAFIASGGAVKGVSHLGALQALIEIGVRPDVFVGTSAGAIVGALYSQGFTVEEMIDWLRFPWTRGSKHDGLSVLDFMSLPKLRNWQPGHLTSGFLSLDRFEKALRKRLPTNDFRRLETTFLATATNIDTGQRCVFGKNYLEDVPISEAVAASSCIPLLFRPFRIGNNYYLDGEIVRTLSLDLAIEAGAQIIVISNVNRPHFTKTKETPVAKRGPFAVVRQSLNIVLSEKEKRGVALLQTQYPRVRMLNVSADLGSFPFLGKAHIRKILTRGYRQAVQILKPAARDGLFGSAPAASLGQSRVEITDTATDSPESHEPEH